MNTTEAVACRTGLPLRGVAAVVELLDQGATVPFISRYRKERTGALDEVAVRAIESALAAVRQLEQRKEFVRQAIADADALTPELESRLEGASTVTEVEDIYAPFKPKRRTRATMAREKGLEPLAKIIMAGRTADCHASAQRFVNKDVADADEAIEGAMDIMAEWASESTRLRNITRKALRRTAEIRCSAVKGKEAELAASPYKDYADFAVPVRRCSSHQYLAIRRAEHEGLLKVKYVLADSARVADDLADSFIPRDAGRECARIIGDAVADAFKRLLLPSAETDISAELKEVADRVAIDIFADNLRQLLLAAPLQRCRVLAIDPAYRTGCKIVYLDEQGNLLADSVIYPTAPKNDIAGATSALSRMNTLYKPETVAIGNGTASRETRQFILGCGLFDAKNVYVVSEDGASVYSASDIAWKEFPDKDVTVRGAVSIGRRLIDPLAELVKIEPKSIGVGQYQHDVDQVKLKDALDYTVMSCVNAVGVNVNTASERLLSYVSGIGPQLAANIVKYRTENGAFDSRAQLRKVPRLGDKAFELCAGFLRVAGSNPLDNTGIHPESYDVVSGIARSVKVPLAQMPCNIAVLDALDARKLAAEGLGGEETIRDIIAELRKPGRDPRTDNEQKPFEASVEDFSQIAEGMILDGTVCNITAFGAFVDLGIKEKGLIHISQVADRRVGSVAEVLKLGQRVTARVLSVDPERHRISLSLRHE